MLGIGAFTPLTGFMSSADWRSVCDRLALADGAFWPVPITLSAGREEAGRIRVGQDVALADEETGELMAVLTVEEKYEIDKPHECREVFRTVDPAHPGVAAVTRQGEVNLAGPVAVLSEGAYPERYPGLYMRPEETRAALRPRRGGRRSPRSSSGTRCTARTRPSPRSPSRCRTAC